ncbi:MAG: hypothetical protein QFX33_00620 [Candidatus Nezhaarchaeota archaeon]|nr:hypothetical protein [Candidatus Nezhaarchaeota archaeon]
MDSLMGASTGLTLTVAEVRLPSNSCIEHYVHVSQLGLWDVWVLAASKGEGGYYYTFCNRVQPDAHVRLKVPS